MRIVGATNSSKHPSVSPIRLALSHHFRERITILGELPHFLHLHLPILHILGQVSLKHRCNRILLEDLSAVQLAVVEDCLKDSEEGRSAAS